MGWNDSGGVSPGGTTLGESVLVERLQGSRSVLGWNDSTGVILFWDRMTPGESFYPEMERLQGCSSFRGWNDSSGVILS